METKRVTDPSGESVSSTAGKQTQCPSQEMITRTRLHRILDASAEPAPSRGRVFLLCAPAGAGKSVLLNQWSERAFRDFGTQCAWLHTTEHENNVSVFCSSLLRALNSIMPMPTTAPPNSLHALDNFIAELASVIEDFGETTILIVDDAHEIHDPLVTNLIGRLLRAAPANFSLIFAARHEPPQSWNTLRLEGRLTYLESADLAFEAAEIKEVFDRSGIALDDATLATIARRTQGWGALVRFAAMYLSGRHDIAQAVAEFEDTPRPVSDYLVGEVISSLTSQARAFVLRTSVPARFTAELAEALTGADARAQLDELERLNMPLTRIDAADHSTWYSYHPMLREHLSAEYCRRDAHAMRDAHVQASRWLESHYYCLAALEHELAIGDETRIIEFLGRRGLGMIYDGLGQELISALAAVSTDVAEDPGTRLLHAATAVADRDFAASSAYLDLVQNVSWRSDSQRSLFLALQLETTRHTSDPRHSLLLDTLRRHPSCSESDVEAYVRLQLGVSLNLHHEFREAALCLEKAVTLAQLRNRHALALESLTHAAMTAGMTTDIDAMAHQSDAALVYAREHDLTHRPVGEQAASVSVLAGYLRGTPADPDSNGDTTITACASSHARRSSSSTSAPYDWRTSVIFALHSLELTHENRRPAASVLRDAMSRLIDDGGHRTDTLAMLPIVVHACLNVGEVEWATRILQEAAGQFGDTADVRLGRAAIKLATGKIAEARADIDAVALSPRFVMASGVYAAVVDACIYTRQSNMKLARPALETAVARARTSGAVRPFFDMKTELHTLLTLFSGHFGDNNDFAEHLRQRLGADTTRARLVLTPAESRTLRELASGDTTEAMAATLWVSVNTVKTHLRGIYRKLGVANRREALLMARTIGLL